MLTKSTTRRALLGTALTLTVAAAAARSAAGQDAALIAKGEAVYAAQKCQLCHAIGGKGNKQNPLDGVGKKLSADDIRHWIVQPAQMTAKAKSTKKPPMPNKYGALPQADLDALTAYLQSLK